MTTKFNVKFSESTYACLADLAQRLDTSMADIIRDAVSLYGWIVKEHEQGNQFLVQRGKEMSELVISSLIRLEWSAGQLPQSVEQERGS